MSLLSAVELLELVEQDVITNVDRSSINAASIDVHLGTDFLVEVDRRYSKLDGTMPSIDLSKREKPEMHRFKNNVLLSPGDFCLASTIEMFNMPDNISGQFMLKSSIARSGLEHLMAGFIDPGFNNSVLTLELINVLRYSNILISAGMAIGQVIFFKHNTVPAEFSYRTKGRYNCDKTTQESKP